MSLKILFSGCSVAAGLGLEREHLDADNYCNVFSNSVFDNPDITNISVPGYSNLRIFLDTSTEIIKNQYDYVFVSWTSYPRYVFWCGLETYTCKRVLLPSSPIMEHNGADITFSSNFFNKLRNDFLLVNHPHYDILDIVKYVNLLNTIASSRNTKIYFINNLCQWDENYFSVIENDIIPSNLTAYTNKILSSDNRDDPQISTLYKQIHNEYKKEGSIRPELWLNLYQNIKSIRIDTGIDNQHPGKLTHRRYGSFLAHKFSKFNKQ